MKLIVDAGRVLATATDDYTGPQAWLAAPEGFDPARMGDYNVTEAGALELRPPQSVTMRQARLALLGAGALAGVAAAIAAIEDETQRAAAQIEWDYAHEVRRDSALVSLMGAGLGLDEAQVDALFAQAAQL